MDGSLDPAVRPLRPLRAIGLASFRVPVLRPIDLVAFDLECVGLDLVTDDDGSTVLVPRPGAQSLLIMHLGPQHIGERAFFEVRGDQSAGTDPQRQDQPKGPAGGDPLTGPPVEARFADPSRVVFTVPATHGPIEWSVAGILSAIRHLAMRIADHAEARTEEESRGRFEFVGRLVDAVSAILTASRVAPVEARAALMDDAARVVVSLSAAIDTIRGGRDGLDPLRLFLRQPVPPGQHETAIEAPFRLLISPNEYGRWQHESHPVPSRDHGVHRVELWHTSLRDIRPDHTPTVRAIWNRHRVDVDDKGTYPHDNKPFRMSLDDADRSMLVDLTANYALNRRRAEYVPTAVEARRLLLSGLGATLDLRGGWDRRPDGVSLQEWIHRAPMGRDQYVKVVYAGYLFKLRHQAALIKITERRIDRSTGQPVAYLFQHMYIVVREPVVHYEGHRDMPFSSVRITSLVTPEIDKPENHSIGAGYGARAFWPTLADGKPFLFHCVATDERGKEAHFDTPLIFIDEGLFTASGAKPADVVATAKTAWDSHFGPDNAPVDPDWHNQQVTLAPTATPGDTTFAVTTMGFTGELAAGDEPPFRPRVRRAAVVVPAVQNLTGKPDPVPVRYFGPYVASGFGATNPGEVFLERVSEQDAVAVDFGGAADRGGGLVKPNFDITAISRTKGPSGGAASSAATGGFDPLAFFGSGGGPLLFGVFSLADVVSGVAPTFVSEALTAFQAFATDAARLADLVQQAAASAGAAAADVTSLTAAEGAVTAAVAKVQAALDAAAQDPAQAAADLAGATASVTGTLDALNAAAGGLPLPVALAADLAGRVSVLRQLLTGGPLGDAMTALQHGAGLVDSLRRVRLEWSPKMSSFPNDPDMWIFGADAQTKFTLAVELRRNAGPDGKEAPPGVDISCALENFKVRLVPPLSMMVLHFDRVAFRSHDGKKPDVDVKFADNGVEFVGILSFVQTLKSLIPLDGFSDPPNIEVGSDGVKAGFSLGLPNLAIGVFSLENMSLGADFKVPFIGDPVSAGFNFCTRERPFTLTVSMLGGGGFFGIRVSPKGVMLLEAAIEFGAALSVDLGVASGSVSIMAGIYFKMENDACSLTGYFRLRGEVEVLGLISASIELYLGLTYEFSSGKMTGTATISVEVEVLCFSTTAHISVEKKFAGANGDPTLAELFDPSGTGGPGSPWFDYCEAFAEV